MKFKEFLIKEGLNLRLPNDFRQDKIKENGVDGLIPTINKGEYQVTNYSQGISRVDYSKDIEPFPNKMIYYAVFKNWQKV